MSTTDNKHEASVEQTEKLKKILRDNGILHEVKNVTITEPPELKGEHFATATVYVNIEFADSSIKPKNLFMKTFTSNEGHTAMVKLMRVMEKESTFFNRFLPELRDFCKEYEGLENILSFFSKCLYADDEMVVLENLVLDDTYVMLSKEDRQDFDTAKLVLNNLAKFHAVTYAFIEKSGREAFRAKWELVCTEAFLMEENPMMAPMFDNGISTAINYLNGNPVEGSIEAIEYLQGLLGKAYGIVQKTLKESKNGKLSLINHGDFQNNNMLFRKDPVTGKVFENMFVDFQITRYGSPNLDIGYFLYTSVKSHVRRAHLKELLQYYFDIFGKTLALLKIPVVPMSFEEFFQDYKINSQLGFYINLTFVCAMGAMKDLDMETLSGDPEEMMKAFNDAVQRWIAKEPKWAKEITTELVAVLKEHQELCPDK